MIMPTSSEKGHAVEQLFKMYVERPVMQSEKRSIGRQIFAYIKMFYFLELCFGQVDRFNNHWPIIMQHNTKRCA